VLKKLVPWIIGLVVLLTAVIGTINFFSAKQEEAKLVKWFASTQRYYGHTKRSQFEDYYYGSSSVERCVKPTGGSWSEDFQFVDDFNECVKTAEQRMVPLDAKLPSEACFALPEKSRQALECIVAAERPVLIEKAKRDQEEQDAADAKREAELKAQEAKEKAADKAITPAVLSAIAAQHPNSDTERRQVAIVVSCKYDDRTAGYRVSLSEYTKASQSGVNDVVERFDDGRYAICNQQQASDGTNQEEAISRQMRDWEYSPYPYRNR